MRLKLLWNPTLFCERLGMAAQRHRRLSLLKRTPARNLEVGHIDTLELLQLSHTLGIETIYDIGANVGHWTLLAKAVFPASRVEAFEPLPVHAEKFQLRLDGVGGATLHRIALGAQNGIAQMAVTDYSDASSMLTPTDASYAQFHVAVDHFEAIEQRCLDDFVKELQIPPADLIKLDVQGYELEVLRGGRQTLAIAKAVITEVSFVEYYKGQCLFADIVQFLSGNGFQLCAVGVNTPTGTELRQTDALFIADRVRLPHRRLELSPSLG